MSYLLPQDRRGSVDNRRYVHTNQIVRAVRSRRKATPVMKWQNTKYSGEVREGFWPEYRKPEAWKWKKNRKWWKTRLMKEGMSFQTFSTQVWVQALTKINQLLLINTHNLSLNVPINGPCVGFWGTFHVFLLTVSSLTSSPFTPTISLLSPPTRLWLTSINLSSA